MSFRNQIVGKPLTVSLVSYENPKGDFLSAPKNLRGSVVGQGEDVALKWDPPETEIPIFGYDVFVDGTFHAIAQSESYLFEGMEFDVQYDFKVRAIGPVGIKSGFSNSVSFTGGGLPKLDPYFYENEFQAGSIQWQDIRDNQYYTVEGYNVYGNLGGAFDSGDQLNSSLLGLNILSFTYFAGSLDTQLHIGVSFEYDGGTESDIFDVTGRTLGDTTVTTFVASQGGLGSNELVTGPNGSIDNLGVRVKEGIEVLFYSYFDIFKKEYWREWSSSDDYDFYWDLYGLNTKPAVRRWYDGCTADDGMQEIKSYGDLTKEGLFEGAHSVGFYVSRGNWAPDNGGWFPLNFTFTGPVCDGQSAELSIATKFSIRTENILEKSIGKSGNFTLTEKPPDRQERLDVDISNNNPTFNWYIYGGVSVYELYIREKGTSSWGSPVETQTLAGRTGQYTEDTLTADTYEAKVRYIQPDDTTYYVTESNIVEFTIS